MAMYDDTLRNLMALLDQDSSSNRSLIFRHLCDLIVQNRPIAQGEQRAGVLAVISRILSSVEPLARMEVAEVLCALPSPPVDLAIILASDDMTVARWILDHAHFSDSDWLRLIPNMRQDHLARLAKREDLNPNTREAILDALDPNSGQLSDKAVTASESQLQDMLERLHRFGESVRELHEDPAEDSAQPHPPKQMQDDAGRASHLFIPENHGSYATIKAGKPCPQHHHPSTDPRLFGVDALWESDRFGVLNFVSSARQNILGIEADHIAGHAIEALLDLSPDIEQRIQSKRPYDGVAPLKAEGTSTWAIAAVPVFESYDGQFSGYRGTLRAVDKPHMPKQTPQSVEPKSDRNPLNLAHEIRTPLNAIRGFAEMIDNEVLGPVSPPYRHRSNKMLTETKRIENLVNDLLDAGRLEAGRLEYSASATDIRLLIGNALSVLSEENHNRVDISYDDDIGPVWGDYALLTRVMGKIIRTAACWTAPGHSVTVDVTSTVDRTVRILANLPKLQDGQRHPEFGALMWCSQEMAHPLIHTSIGYGLGPDFAVQLADLFGGSLRLITGQTGHKQLVLTLQSSEQA